MIMINLPPNTQQENLNNFQYHNQIITPNTFCKQPILRALGIRTEIHNIRQSTMIIGYLA